MSDSLEDHVHRNLLENIKQIHGAPKITPATRTESATEVSEFNISAKKRTKTGKSTFQESDLIRSLKKKKPQIAQKLEVAKRTRTLSKPLETVFEKKAQREAGYQSVRTRLGSWKDIVLSNRVADQLSFPLKNQQIEIYDHTDGDLFSSFENLTPLEQKFQKILNSSKTSKDEEKKLEQSKVRLTLKEMIEQRKKFAKIKVQTSYQIAKSRRQNKIKSKKYHRILRREKTKQQLKDFELLRKTDPEAALKQLEQLERSRAQERATLRHRNTGKWAQNQLIKAKYNRESREAISEQLAKSRELTEKVDLRKESSDSDSGEDEVPSKGSNNTWFANEEYSQFVNKYKEWKEREDSSAGRSECVVEPANNTEEIPVECDEKETDVSNINVQCVSRLSPKKKISKTESEKKISKPVQKKLKLESRAATNKTETCTEIRNSSGVWIVTSCSNLEESSEKSKISTEFSVSELFNSLDEKLERKFEEKLKRVQCMETNPAQNERTKRRRRKSKKKKSVNDDVIPSAEKTQKPEESDKSQETEQPRQPVDTFSRNSLPDSLTTANEALDDDFDVEDDQKMTIGDVLAAEDVVSEFRMEKQKAEEDEKPQIIDTSLPGWGAWTDGSSVREKDQKKPKYRRTNKRLLFKIPKAPPRKEANKGFVILKESVPEKLKEHMVSELPYPFTKVKDFEAHVRAPIGRTWLPETAHQQLIAPPIVTKLGTVIEPMDEGVLIQHEKLHKN